MEKKLQQTNKSEISRGKTSPASVISRLRKAKMFDQLCILVLDGSGSMLLKLKDGVTKADATASAAKELVELLKRSSKSPSFSLGMICFADVVETRLHSQYVDGIDIKKINFIPFTNGVGDKTLVLEALKEAENMGSAFLNSGELSSTLKRTVRIILMSDGYAHDFEKAVKYAEQLREKWSDKIRICTSLLGNESEKGIKIAEEFLSQIASKEIGGNPYYSKSTSGTDLRVFFESSSTAE